MPRFVIVHVTSDFTRAFRRLPKQIQRLAVRKDQQFQQNSFSPQLETHKLKGELDGFWSYSVNKAYRVLFRFVTDTIVLYYDIGMHDIYR